MAEYDIQAKVTYDTTQAQASLKGVAQAAGETAKQTEKVGDATQKSQVQIGQFGSALGLAGQAAGKLSPALGGIISVAGSATGVIQGLTTAGLGPLGIALGAVSVGLTAAIGLWDAFSGAQKDAADETGKLTQQLYRAADAFDELAARRKRQQEQAQRGARIGLGVGTAEEMDIERQRIQERLDVLTATNFREQNAREIRRLEQRQQELEENIRVAEAFGPAPAAAQAPSPERAERRRGNGGRSGGVRAAAPAEREDPNAAARAAGEELDRLWEQSERRLAERRARWEDEAAFQAELNEIEANDVRLRLESLERDETEAERLREKNAEEHAERMQAINDAVFSALESALASSVDAWLSGTRSMGEAMQDMVKQVAKSLASEAIIQGLKATAMGLGALAVGSPSAALHFAEAGKWAAVGVAAGIVGAASGAFGGGGGGGGGAPAAATGGPALTPGAATGAGTTVVINWGSSGLVYAADRAQLGRDISGMISEAHGRLGRGM